MKIQGACLPSFYFTMRPVGWYLMSESCLQAGDNPRSSLFLSFFWAPLPPTHAGPPAEAKQGCQVILNTNHSLSTKLLSPHPPSPDPIPHPIPKSALQWRWLRRRRRRRQGWGVGVEEQGGEKIDGGSGRVMISRLAKKKKKPQQADNPELS